MTIHELSRRTGISLRNLRALNSLGVLNVEPENAGAAAIRFQLAKNPTMTAAQFVLLLDEPDLIYDLGRYEARARGELMRLGDVKATAAPRGVTAYVEDAARGDVEAARILADWARGALPLGNVGHAWLAVRLLFPLVPALRESAGKAMALALLNARKHMAGFFHKEGKFTVYHQYRGTGLDL